MNDYRERTRVGIAGLADKLYPGTLWGHGVRGLVWNPVFAVLPLFYLDRFAAASGPAAAFWLCAFVLGYPHAGYTALEFRHYLRRDGVADARTPAQAVFFGVYALLGCGLAAWYVAQGAVVIGQAVGVGRTPLLLVLALGGGVGTVMGLQDVLVMDMVRRPGRVVTGAVAALAEPRWLRITLAWALVQLASAALMRSLLPA
jgi:hypothetical protein